MNFNILAYKACKKCEKRKSVSEFYPKGKGRLETNCKDCSRKNKSLIYKLRISKEKRVINRKWELIPIIVRDLEC
jgi:hypothetical protein